MIAETTFSTDQLVAVDTITRWLKGGGDLTLGGYAGTGKTTLLKHLWPDLEDAGAIVMAPTGKAGQVLRNKGLQATTIHKLIYQFRGVSEDMYGKESPIFMDLGKWGTLDGERPRRLVCDEASMVSTSLYNDIHDRRIPTLWLGDHGQLAPVGGDPGLMRNPQIRLEKIHRQAANNTILQLAHRVREGHVPNLEDQSNNVSVFKTRKDADLVSIAIEQDCDQILVATNALRHSLNSLFRKTLKYRSTIEEGDKIICLLNDYRYGMFNGQIFKVVEIGRSDDEVLFLRLAEETATGWNTLNFYVPIQISALGNPGYKSTEKVAGAVVFDYAYAISVHKSQGSEYRNVLLAYQNVPMFDMRRWAYTGITRAKEFISIVLRD